MSSVYGGKTYNAGKTVAYIIIPFAAVAGTYYVFHHHQVEINPYGGFFWPGHGDDHFHLRDEGLYGLKVLASITDNIQLEGNFGYINHVENRFGITPLDQALGIRPATVHGLIYDINGLYNFGARPVFGTGVAPYVVAGVGGLSTLVEDGSTALLSGQIYTTNPATGAIVLDPGRKTIVSDNSAFFSINYGAGLKVAKLWGPMGARVDIRARTFPNFRGQTITWPEASAGLLFTLGEK